MVSRGRLTWLLVCFWAHVKYSCIVLYRIVKFVNQSRYRLFQTPRSLYQCNFWVKKQIDKSSPYGLWQPAGCKIYRDDTDMIKIKHPTLFKCPNTKHYNCGVLAMVYPDSKALWDRNTVGERCRARCVENRDRRPIVTVRFWEGGSESLAPISDSPPQQRGSSRNPDRPKRFTLLSALGEATLSQGGLS